MLNREYAIRSFNPSEQYEFVSWVYYSQLNEKIKFMFQTTNQLLSIVISD